jgi:hypothetical protein
MFHPQYDTLLQEARERIADGFEGEVPGMQDGK